MATVSRRTVLRAVGGAIAAGIPAALVLATRAPVSEPPLAFRRRLYTEEREVLKAQRLTKGTPVVTRRERRRARGHAERKGQPLATWSAMATAEAEAMQTPSAKDEAAR